MNPITTGVSAAPAPTPEQARLRKVSGELEGVFVLELFKAMRETVPNDQGVVDGGMGEEIFSGMMDQELATEVASGWERGLGAALYRQLQKLMPAPDSAAPLEPPANVEEVK